MFIKSENINLVEEVVWGGVRSRDIKFEFRLKISENIYNPNILIYFL